MKYGIVFLAVFWVIFTAVHDVDAGRRKSSKRKDSKSVENTTKDNKSFKVEDLEKNKTESTNKSNVDDGKNIEQGDSTLPPDSTIIDKSAEKLTSVYPHKEVTRLTNIYVARFSNSRVKRGDLERIEESLGAELSATGRYKVLGYKDVENRLRKKGYDTFEACTEPWCAVKRGELLKREKVIIGSISQKKGKYTILMQLVDVKSGKIENTIGRQYEGTVDGICRVGMREIAQAFAGIENNNLTVSKTVPDKSGAKRNLIIGLSSGAVVAGVITAMVFRLPEKFASEKESEVIEDEKPTETDLILEW